MKNRLEKWLGKPERLRGWAAAAAFLLSLVSPAAHASLQGFAPTPALMPPGTGSPGVSIGGIPAWYQDINGVSLKPCLDIATCGLIGLGDPMFNEALPLSYPDNFPTEWFYFDAVANFAVGPSDALVVMALEFTFIDPVTGALIVAPPRPANALGVPFMRIRLRETLPAGTPVPTAGSFTVTTPWGPTVFPANQAVCKASPASTICTMTQDLPVPGAIPPAFAAALGTGVPGTISTFIKDPLAPAGFIGTAAGAISFTGAVAPNANSITVADPTGATGTTTSLTLLIGQLVGLSAAPAAIAFPPQKAALVAGPTTVTITNPDAVNPATLGTAAMTGANAADFALVADTCSGATLPPAGTCTFGVTFTEAAAVAVTGAKSATVNVPVTAPANMPPTIVNLTGAIDITPPTIASVVPASGAVQVPINNSVIVTFSEPMDPATVNASSVSVTGPAGAVPGTVALDATGAIVTFTPAANLPINTELTVSVSAGAADPAGNPLAAYTSLFTTGAVADTASLEVNRTIPPNNEVAVALDAVIAAVFNKPLNEATLNTGSFFLNPPTPGVVSFDPIGLTASFKPLGPLAANTLFTATIASDVTDLTGHSLPADVVFTFTTEDPANRIQLISPDNGASGLDRANVVLQWEPVEKNADKAAYSIFVCENESFANCEASTLTASELTASASTGTGHRDPVRAAAATDAGMIVSGLVLMSGARRRRKLALLLLTATALGSFLVSCGSSGPSTLSFTPDNLKGGTAYHWKIVADDGAGGKVNSETRVFTTAP